MFKVFKPPTGLKFKWSMFLIRIGLRQGTLVPIAKNNVILEVGDHFYLNDQKYSVTKVIDSTTIDII